MNASKSRKVAFMGLLFALAIVLSYLESLVPTVLPVPGIKLGLSNIVTMYCLFFLNAPAAILLALLKAAFVLITRGGVAALLSASGGLCSVGVMLLAKKLRASGGLTSVIGAVTHNLAQLVTEYLFFKTAVLFYYLPVLVISGVIMGVITAMILKAVLPLIKSFNET
jgi:heptaprenyl diphosphate synthase